MQDRLQKIIARAGVTSRRAAEELITGGRVRVNGRIVTELGTKADPREDKIEVDGKRLTAPAPVYVVLHKPRNVVSTMSDPEGRPSVAELLRGVDARVYPVGRLDFATSGVLLATNDGEFSQGLLHPKKGVPKTYVVKVTGLMDQDDLERWASGVDLDDGRTLPAEVSFLRHEEDKTWFEITITEGRNQQLRRMGEATGFPVMRLARVSFAGISNEGLRPGQWRFLTASELMDLRKEHGVPRRVRSADTSGRGGRVFGKVTARGEMRSRSGDRPARDDRPRGEHAPRRDLPPRARRPHDDRPHDDTAPQRATRPWDDTAPPRAGRPHDDAPRAGRPHDDTAPPRARRPHDDTAPPRGKRPHDDTAPPRGKRPHGDTAPPRGKRPHGDTAPPRGKRPHDDTAPPRARRPHDDAPPRAKRPHDDAPPPRGKRPHGDTAPPRARRPHDDTAAPRPERSRQDAGGPAPTPGRRPGPRSRAR